MIANKEEVTAAVDSLWDAFGNYERGRTIEWYDVERLLSMSRHDTRARHVINRFRRRLERERKIVSLVATDVGIRLLTHHQAAVEIPEIRQRKAYRQINRSLKQTACVDQASLNNNERRLLSAQTANMRYSRLQIGRSRRELKKAVSATEAAPRRAVVSVE